MSSRFGKLHLSLKKIYEVKFIVACVTEILMSLLRTLF